eukprot:6017877-Amphidinium_carterae.2
MLSCTRQDFGIALFWISRRVPRKFHEAGVDQLSLARWKLAHGPSDLTSAYRLKKGHDEHLRACVVRCVNLCALALVRHLLPKTAADCDCELRE